MKSEMLEIVNENDEVIGQETRTKIHQEGLLHREIHVYFITPHGEIIFQHRAKDKDTYPDKLDATVGGHVEPGMDYEKTAIKECEEETGIKIDSKKLILLAKLRKQSFDEITNTKNNTFRAQYAYLYNEPINNLKVEAGKGLGFEAWKINNLPNLTNEEKNKFISVFLEEDMLELYSKMKGLLIK